jgi:predicted RNA methylase
VGCFSSADESAHYGFSVCMLLEQYRDQLGWETDGVVELGTGDATAISDVVSALPGLRVRSYDISATSIEAARANIAARGIADRYVVELGDFFDQADSAGGPPVATVISNPPYIPAPDRDILMPELWGGVHGNDLVLQLLKAGYDNVIAAVASYSDPETTVRTAEDLGYRVANFLAMGLDFGPYSNEPKVRRHIRRLCAQGRGWAGEDGYMVAVAIFTRSPDLPGDRAGQLLRALQIDV